MSYSFCHHCGASIGQDQADGQRLVCRSCGKEIGTVSAAAPKVMVDGTEELIRQGKAARCPLCRQAVEVRSRDSDKTFVPHQPPGQKRICPNSGKPVAAPAAPAPAAAAPKPPSGKDLSAYMHRETIRVIACRKDGTATVEELSLEYLDRNDRVRIQIEALRELLGPAFQMRAYPPPLRKPDFACWSSAGLCVIAKKHSQGGIQPMTEQEQRAILEDVRLSRQAFFGT